MSTRTQYSPRFFELHHRVVVTFSFSLISTLERLILPGFMPNWCT